MDERHRLQSVVSSAVKFTFISRQSLMASTIPLQYHYNKMSTLYKGLSNSMWEIHPQNCKNYKTGVKWIPQTTCTPVAWVHRTVSAKWETIFSRGFLLWVHLCSGASGCDLFWVYIFVTHLETPLELRQRDKIAFILYCIFLDNGALSNHYLW